MMGGRGGEGEGEGVSRKDSPIKFFLCSAAAAHRCHLSPCPLVLYAFLIPHPLSPPPPAPFFLPPNLLSSSLSSWNGYRRRAPHPPHPPPPPPHQQHPQVEWLDRFGDQSYKQRSKWAILFILASLSFSLAIVYPRCRAIGLCL